MKSELGSRKSEVGSRKSFGAQHAVRQNLRAQSAAAAQALLRAGREGNVHPLARCALGRAEKADALHLELFADQRRQVGAGRDHIAPKDRWRPIPHAELGAQLLVHFIREKSDLAFVLRLEIEEAVALDAAPGDALDLGAFEHRMPARRLAMVAEEIVPRRNEEQ